MTVVFAFKGFIFLVKVKSSVVVIKRVALYSCKTIFPSTANTYPNCGLTVK